MESSARRPAWKLGGKSHGISEEKATSESEKPVGEFEATRRARPESWVDAVVTLLATILFGLGWALVELERADPVGDRYDTGASVAWMSADQIREPGGQWTDEGQQRSRR